LAQAQAAVSQDHIKVEKRAQIAADRPQIAADQVKSASSASSACHPKVFDTALAVSGSWEWIERERRPAQFLAGALEISIYDDEVVVVLPLPAQLVRMIGR
jgi:hypothetical protein